MIRYPKLVPPVRKHDSVRKYLMGVVGVVLLGMALIFLFGLLEVLSQ